MFLFGITVDARDTFLVFICETKLLPESTNNSLCLDIFLYENIYTQSGTENILILGFFFLLLFASVLDYAFQVELQLVTKANLLFFSTPN